LEQYISKYYFFDKKTLKEKLLNFGLAIFHKSVTKYEFKNFINSLGSIYHHQHSNPDGFTPIQSSKSDKPAFKGFTNKKLELHSDRSCVENTPVLLSIYFENIAKNGGESNFIDTKDVIRFLNKSNSSTLKLLLNEKCIFFDGNHELESPIISVVNNTAIVRYRNDEFIYFSERLKKIIPFWEKYLLEYQFTHKFKEGEFYILNNTRVLHGRNKFVGYRKVIRALLSNEEFLQRGFELSQL